MPATTTSIAPPPRLTLQEAASRGLAGYSTLRKKIASGELAAEKIGRQYVVLESDLQAMTKPVVGRPTEGASIEAAINRVVAAAPRLTHAQRERLAGVLGTAR